MVLKLKDFGCMVGYEQIQYPGRNNLLLKLQKHSRCKNKVIMCVQFNLKLLTTSLQQALSLPFSFQKQPLHLHKAQHLNDAVILSAIHSDN